MDDQLYKLEDSFKSLNHDIIKSRAELGLINNGVKFQLKSMKEMKQKTKKRTLKT